MVMRNRRPPGHAWHQIFITAAKRSDDMRLNAANRNHQPRLSHRLVYPDRRSARGRAKESQPVRIITIRVFPMQAGHPGALLDFGCFHRPVNTQGRDESNASAINPAALQLRQYSRQNPRNGRWAAAIIDHNNNALTESNLAGYLLQIGSPNRLCQGLADAGLSICNRRDNCRFENARDSPGFGKF